MNIAICEDSLPELQQLGEMIRAFSAEHGTAVSFQLFSDAKSMISAAASQRFTHYFLDIIMPDMDGVAAANEIRLFDQQAKIVFMTASNDYAYQSYQVRAYDYLLKPISQAHISDLLLQFIAQEQASPECLCIQTARSLLRIPYAHISHVEINQKKLYFFLTDGSIRNIPGTLSEFESILLAHPAFIKTHRSYIVNLNQVTMLSAEGCAMFSGKVVPVSRLLYQQVHKQYLAHLFSDKEVH